jgi:hypothetical protein
MTTNHKCWENCDGGDDDGLAINNNTKGKAKDAGLKNDLSGCTGQVMTTRAMVSQLKPWSRMNSEKCREAAQHQAGSAPCQEDPAGNNSRL